MVYRDSEGAKRLVTAVCKILAGRILEEHRACMTWEDEVSSTHDCSHLSDARIVMKFIDEWQQYMTTERS